MSSSVSRFTYLPATPFSTRRFRHVSHIAIAVSMGLAVSAVMILWTPTSHAQIGVPIDINQTLKIARQVSFVSALAFAHAEHCTAEVPRLPEHVTLCGQLNALLHGSEQGN